MGNKLSEHEKKMQTMEKEYAQKSREQEAEHDHAQKLKKLDTAHEVAKREADLGEQASRERHERAMQEAKADHERAMQGAMSEEERSKREHEFKTMEMTLHTQAQLDALKLDHEKASQRATHEHNERISAMDKTAATTMRLLDNERAKGAETHLKQMKHLDTMSQQLTDKNEQRKLMLQFLPDLIKQGKTPIECREYLQVVFDVVPADEVTSFAALMAQSDSEDRSKILQSASRYVTDLYNVKPLIQAPLPQAIEDSRNPECDTRSVVVQEAE